MQQRQFSFERLLDHLGHVHTAFWIATGAGGVMAVIAGVIKSLLPHSGWLPQALVFVISVAMVYVGLRRHEQRIRSAVLNASAPASYPDVKPRPAILTEGSRNVVVIEPEKPTSAPLESRQAKSDQKPEERIIIDIPPAELTKLYSLYTGVQAEKLAAIYIGKWMRVSGPLGEVDSFQSFMQVTFSLETGPRPYGVGFFYMYFGMEWSERLSVLQRGSIINVLGRIRNIEASAFHLEECELVEESNSVTSQT